jgi:hypothetical protein
MGKFRIAANADVDPSLLSWIQRAAAASPYDVRLQSGYRPGDPRFHGKRKAVDVQLIDPGTGKVIPNYQTASSFASYRDFANQVRGAQMQSDPNAANALRWGGYFSGGKGKYGALDLMHFDIGGDTTPMGGGSWAAGLTPEQAKIWGLQAGGGYSGAPGVGAVPPAGGLASVFGGAIDTDPSFNWGKAAAGAGQRAAAGGPQRPRETPSTPVQTITPDVLEAAVPASQAPLDAVLDETGLANLFKVDTIGQAPKPQQRKWS